MDQIQYEWAVKHVEAGLWVGLTVPEIEARLVEKGLTPIQATAVVNEVLSGEIHANQEYFEREERAIVGHRIALIVIALVCLGLAYLFGQGYSVMVTTFWLMWPVASVWWSEQMGELYEIQPVLLRWVAWISIGCILAYRLLLLWLIS